MNGTETTDELPEGWIMSKLGELSRLESGAGFPIEFQFKTGLKYPFFKVGNLAEVNSGDYLTKSANSVDEVLAQKLGAKIIPVDAIVFAKIGMAIRLNRRRCVGRPCCIDNNMMAAIPSAAIGSRFLLRLLETVDLMPLATATTVPSLRKSSLEEIAIPLPPLSEQKRIIAKLEMLLARVNAARRRLAKAPVILKRFRQAVLAAACSGQLTEDWREEHGKQIPSKTLLEEVLVKRREAFQKKHEGGNHRKYPEPLEIDNCDHPDVPETWLWTSADSICSQITDGEHIQPPYQSDGFPMLTATHIRDGFVNFENYGLITEDAFRNSLKRCGPTEGDILIVSVGATTGRAAVVRNCPAFALVRSVLLLRPLVCSDYFLRWTQASWCFNWMSNASGASAQPHLYISDVRRMPFPLPPLAEQHEIVRRVEALLARANRIEKQLAAATRRVETLTQAILAQAFRGELVPTEAELARREGRDFESAGVLLQRIRIEREQAAPANGFPRKGRRKKATH